MLEDGTLDATVGFKEPPGRKVNAVYKEFVKVPLVCICPAGHPLAEKEEVSLSELEKEKLVLFVPSRSAFPAAQVQEQLMGDRPPTEFYFCESAESIIVLVTAGYGISVLPAYLIPETPQIRAVPVTDGEPFSFGVYYRTIQGNPALKSFIRCAKDFFASK